MDQRLILNSLLQLRNDRSLLSIQEEEQLNVVSEMNDNHAFAVALDRLSTEIIGDAFEEMYDDRTYHIPINQVLTKLRTKYTEQYGEDPFSEEVIRRVEQEREARLQVARRAAQQAEAERVAREAEVEAERVARLAEMQRLERGDDIGFAPVAWNMDNVDMSTIPTISREEALALFPPPPSNKGFLLSDRAVIKGTTIPWIDFARAIQLRDDQETDIHSVFRSNLANKKRVLEILSAFPIKERHLERWKQCMYDLYYYYQRPGISPHDREIMSPERVWGMIEWLAKGRLGILLQTTNPNDLNRFDHIISLIEAVPYQLKPEIAHAICDGIFASYQNEALKVVTLINWEPNDSASCGAGALDYMLIKCGNVFQEKFGIPIVSSDATAGMDITTWIRDQLTDENEDDYMKPIVRKIKAQPVSLNVKINVLRAYLLKQAQGTGISREDIIREVEEQRHVRNNGIFHAYLGRRRRSKKRQLKK